MIEINFIEEKKHNIVPYITTVVFVLLLVLSGLLLFGQHANHQQTLDSIQRQIDQSIAKQAEVQSVRTIQKQRITLAEQVKYTEETLFPTVLLLNRMIELLPDDSYFRNYTFSMTDGLSIGIRVEDMNQVAAYNHVLLQEDYVETVNMASIERIMSDPAYFIASFQVQLNKQAWMEVAE